MAGAAPAVAAAAPAAAEVVAEEDAVDVEEDVEAVVDVEATNIDLGVFHLLMFSPSFFIHIQPTYCRRS